MAVIVKKRDLPESCYTSIVDKDKMIELAKKYKLHPTAKYNNNLDINPPPSEPHVGYNYTWVNLNTEEFYWGCHQKPLGDFYPHSSKDPKFLRDFTNPDIKWRYNIMSYTMTNVNDVLIEENKRLSELHDFKTGKGGAAKNPMSYNKSNGIPPKKMLFNPPRLDDMVKPLAERIRKNGETNEFTVITMEAQKLVDMIENGEYLQSRAAESKNDINHITDSVNDKGGQTTSCQPVVLLNEVTTPSGVACSKCIGDGMQTIQGVSASIAQHLEVVNIPKEETEDFSISELLALGNHLNPQQIIKKTPCNKKDFERFLHSIWNQYIENNDSIEVDESVINKIINTQQNIDEGITIYGLFHGKGRNGCGKSIQNVMFEISNNLSVSTSEWKDYDLDRYKNKLNDKIKEYENEGMWVIYGRTSWFEQAGAHHLINQILEVIDINKELEVRIKNGEKGLQKYKKIIILLWYKTPEDKKSWNEKFTKNGKKRAMGESVAQEHKKRVYDKILDGHGIELIFDYSLAYLQ